MGKIIAKSEIKCSPGRFFYDEYISSTLRDEGMGIWQGNGIPNFWSVVSLSNAQIGFL